MAEPDVLIASCVAVMGAVAGDSTGFSGPAEDEQLLIAELAERGVVAELRAWDDPDVDWTQGHRCVIRSTWNYPERPEAFRAWLEVIDASMTVWNSPRQAIWNMHKAYLTDLAALGHPVVPTVVVRRGDGLDSARLAERLDATVLVAKPASSAGGFETRRLDVASGDGWGEVEGWNRERDLVLQPFVESILTEGERSVVMIDGSLSHVVQKEPAAGEFRVQEHFGGQNALIETGDEEAALAGAVLDSLDEPTLYARFDTIRIDGRPHVMECELIEPWLFFALAPEAAGRLADAIAARL